MMLGGGEERGGRRAERGGDDKIRIIYPPFIILITVNNNKCGNKNVILNEILMIRMRGVKNRWGRRRRKILKFRGRGEERKKKKEDEIEEFEGRAPRFSFTLFDSMTEMGWKTLLSDEERGGGGE